MAGCVVRCAALLHSFDPAAAAAALIFGCCSLALHCAADINVFYHIAFDYKGELTETLVYYACWLIGPCVGSLC